MTGIMMGSSLAAGYTFKEVAFIPLPMSPGHGDWVSYDHYNGDVYVSLKDKGMSVIDTRTNKVIRTIYNGVVDPNTMTYDKDFVYETAAPGPKKKGNAVVVISKRNWKVVDKVETKGTSPDGIFIDEANHHLYVISDDANWIEVYTTGAHPKFITKYDEVPKNTVAGPDVAKLINGTIYATNDSYVEKINPNTGKVELAVNYHLKLNKFGGTKDMFYDAGHHAIWVATTNHVLYVVDPKTLEIIKPLPEQAGADGLAYDPKLGLAYAFQGGIPGFDAYDVKDMKWIATVRTGSKKPTHSGTVDLANDEVYAFAGGDAAIKVYKPIAK